MSVKRAISEYLLHYAAIRTGILNREREFGSHLSSSVARFIAVAKSAADERVTEEDLEYGDEETHKQLPRSDGGSRASDRKEFVRHDTKTPGKCSTCSAAFPNAQDFYEHLDECIIRLIRQVDSTEINKARRMNTVSNGHDVEVSTLRNNAFLFHENPANIFHPLKLSFREEFANDSTVDSIKQVLIFMLIYGNWVDLRLNRIQSCSMDEAVLIAEKLLHSLWQESPSREAFFTDATTLANSSRIGKGFEMRQLESTEDVARFMVIFTGELGATEEILDFVITVTIKASNLEAFDPLNWMLDGLGDLPYVTLHYNFKSAESRNF